MKPDSRDHDQDSSPSRTAVSPQPSRSGERPAAMPSFLLDSTDLREGQTISDRHVFNGMDRTGQNLSPDLHWNHVPGATKSFAVTLFDPDAKNGKGLWHWVMYDIPANVNHVPTGAGDVSHAFMPNVIQGMTSFGKPGYAGPCPPKGDPPHHYVFSVHALDIERLGVPDAATVDDVESTIHAHIIASARLTATYGR
jgi:Raf kinase inhibitor-like YbhB/YbcL family protein